jgi:hypothetical protein
VKAFPGLCAAAGGALVVLGAFLAWIRFSFAQPALRFLVESLPGTSSAPGRVSLACGALLLACSAGMVASGPGLRRAAAAAAVALGICAAVAAVTALATERSRADAAIRGDVERAVGHTLSSEQLDALGASLHAAGFAATPGAGAFVVLAGGLLGAAGGLTGLALRGGEPLTQILGFAEREPEPPFPPAPEPGPLPAPEPGPSPGPPSLESGEV